MFIFDENPGTKIWLRIIVLIVKIKMGVIFTVIR